MQRLGRNVARSAPPRAAQSSGLHVSQLVQSCVRSDSGVRHPLGPLVARDSRPLPLRARRAGHAGRLGRNVARSAPPRTPQLPSGLLVAQLVQSCVRSDSGARHPLGPLVARDGRPLPLRARRAGHAGRLGRNVARSAPPRMPQSSGRLSRAGCTSRNWFRAACVLTQARATRSGRWWREMPASPCGPGVPVMQGAWIETSPDLRHRGCLSRAGGSVERAARRAVGSELRAY